VFGIDHFHTIWPAPPRRESTQNVARISSPSWGGLTVLYCFINHNFIYYLRRYTTSAVTRYPWPVPLEHIRVPSAAAAGRRTVPSAPPPWWPPSAAGGPPPPPLPCPCPAPARPRRRHRLIPRLRRLLIRRPPPPPHRRAPAPHLARPVPRVAAREGHINIAGRVTG